jgi:DNA-binding MarR family transcriptional regulator
MLSNMAMTTTTETTRAELASHLRLVVMRLTRRLRQHAPADITPSQLSALAVVVRDSRLTLSQLAEAERVQPPSMTRIVESLLQRRLITRTPSDEDRRVAWVAPTPEGIALIAAVRKQRDAYLARHLRALSADDIAVLNRAAELLEGFIEDPLPLEGTA